MYYSKDGYTIVRKHYIVVMLYLVKFIFILLIAFILYFIGLGYKEALGSDVTNYVFLPLILVLVNYSFIRLILGLIEYYNYLFIISGDQIFVINSSLVLRNDIEVIDAFKIIKLDAYSRGIFANLLSFGMIIIELQTKEERIFHFISHPYQLLELLKAQRNEVLESRKKKYIIDDVVVEDIKK